MMAFRSLNTIRALYRTAQISESSYLLGSSRSYANGISNVPELNFRSISCSVYNSHGALPWTPRNAMTLRSTMAVELPVFLNDPRLLSTQVKAPAQARQMGALKVAMLSPGFIYEPYAPREKIAFWKRWFTRSGWRRTKEDVILELKSAYAINKLRKSGYSKHKFYKEAIELYKEINTRMANGDKNYLRKAATERMFSELKNEIKQRESVWSNVYWEMVEPVVKIRTLRARLIGVDRKDTNKVFIQLTLEFLTKQKFEAYNSNGSVVSGDKSKEKERKRYFKVSNYISQEWYPHKQTLHQKLCQPQFRIASFTIIIGGANPQMDGSGKHLESLGICQRLHDFIMRSLISQAFKPVTLGPPMNQGLAQAPISGAVHNEAGTKMDQKVHPIAEGTCGNNTKDLDPSVSLGCSRTDRAEDNKELPPAPIAPQAKIPKKMVSISDRVEDMEKTMKLRRKNNSFEKLATNEPKPSRSILKVGSDLSKKMGTFVNHNHKSTTEDL